MGGLHIKYQRIEEDETGCHKVRHKEKETKYRKVNEQRGNHDAFNEPDQKNSQYMHYVRDNLTATTELFTITKPYGNYSLVAIDGAPVPGFKRPFNFVGYVGQDSLDKLSSIRDQSRHTNQTVLFGHYPTSSE